MNCWHIGIVGSVNDGDGGVMMLVVLIKNRFLKGKLAQQSGMHKSFVLKGRLAHENSLLTFKQHGRR